MADYSAMIGQVYGYWTVVGLSAAPKRVHCKCRCGVERDVNVSQLKHGGSKSCGCMRLKKDGTPSASRSAAKKVEPGQHYNSLTVLEETDQRSGSHVVWKCRCDCGNIAYVAGADLKRGNTKSCGCAGAHTNLMDISGQRFGRLVALTPTEKRSGSNVIWRCQCDCGKVAEVSAINLRNGNTQSCGCLAAEAQGKTAKELLKKLEPYFVGGTYVKMLMHPPTKRNISGKTGVYWDKHRECWGAKITFKGHGYYLGSSKNIAEAIALREEAEKRIHGEFLKWYYETFPERKRKGNAND